MATTKPFELLPAMFLVNTAPVADHTKKPPPFDWARLPLITASVLGMKKPFSLEMATFPLASVLVRREGP
jgi:hypothetical protein